MKKRVTIFVIFSCLLFSGTIQPVQAAQQNIDLTGTEWTLQANGSLSAGQLGSERISGNAYLSFQNNGYVEITDEDDYTIRGEYGYDSDNKFFLTVSKEELADFIDNTIDELGYSEITDIADIAVTSSTSQASLKAGKQELSLSLKFGFVITVAVDASYTNNGKPFKTTVRYNLALKGTHALAAESQQEGAAWIIDIGASCKLRKLKTAGNVTELIYFGPNNAQGLAGGEFLVYVMEEGQWQEVMTGHFIRKGNNITFIPTDESVEDILNSQLSTLIEGNKDIWDAHVIDSVSKFTATVKDGVSIRLNGQSTFYSWMEMANSDDWRGTFTVKGTGIPYVAEPQPD